jgi:Xaa-Pro aminopeptidase
VPFVPHHVFADRTKRIKEYLTEEGLEALIITGPENVYMVSGFHVDVRVWERPVAAVIPLNGDPFLIMHSLSTNHLLMAEERDSLYIRDYELYFEHPRSYPRTYTRDQWGVLLANKLKDRGIKRGRIAVEGSGPVESIKETLPEVELVDGTRQLISMRQVKYPEEIEILRLCAEVTDWGQDRYMELVQPGMVVTAFDFEISKLLMEEAARRFPHDRFEARLRSASGRAASAPHGTGADVGNQFLPNEAVVNIIVCRLNGLTIENERTLFVGEPKSEFHVKAYEAATQACEAAANEMVAGNTVANADAAAQMVLESAGFGQNILHRTGHGVGIDGHEYPEDMSTNYRAFMENEV